MELRHLRYFVAVADELSFTRAAAKLHIAQPSLTRQIHNLEAELGVRLLDRSRNQVCLTEEGKNFLTHARHLVALSLASVKAVQDANRNGSVRLNIGYVFKFDFDVLPATLTSFCRACPNIALNIFDMNPAEQLSALEGRKIDLGFVGLRRPSPAGNSDALAWQCVTQNEIVVVLPSRHPLANKRRVNITDLKSLFFVAMSEETCPGSRAWLSQICQRAAFSPRILQDVSLESGIMTFVAEGLGVTLAREQVKNLPHSGIVFRPLSPATKADYWIAWRRDNSSPALLNYVEIVKREAAHH